MEKKVKVSIIVALYNTIDFLDRFFDSLNSQVFKDFEVIFVDDLSTDGSLEKVKKFKDNTKDFEVKIIEGTEKMFPDLARKIAFKHCQGDYVIFLDSDDEFSDDYLSELYSLAISNDLDIAVSSCQRINELGEKKGKKRFLSKTTIPLMNEKQKRILIKGRYGGWNRMCKTSFLKNHNYDYLSAELPLFILQFDDTARVGYTIKGCYFYRMRGGSISTSKVPERIANYDLLEPIKWYKSISKSKSNQKALSVYLYRMILPYIYYKKSFVKEYAFKKDIKLVKKECDFRWFYVLDYWWIMDKRDKFILPFFVLNMHFVVFHFIKKYRS